MEREDLIDQLEESHQRNGELVELGLAAARASTERDARRIATLEARLRTEQELHRATVEATREDRVRLAEARDQLESIGAAAADYQVKMWDLQEASRHNYHHLCYLGGLVYEERDRAARTRTAWERSDQQRLRELEELSAQLPPQEEATTEDRDLRATPDTPTTCAPVPERLSGHSRDGPCSSGYPRLLRRTGDQDAGLPRGSLTAVLLGSTRHQLRGTSEYPVMRVEI
jgi:hypothetical protein